MPAVAQKDLASPDGEGVCKTEPEGLSPWTLDSLASMCQRKGVVFRESTAFTSLNAVLVRCGTSVSISVRASLPTREKIFVLAHELGHLALDHASTSSGSDSSSIPHVNEDLDASVLGNREQEADIWAAHMLVKPELVAGQMRNSSSRNLDDGVSETQIAKQIGILLNVPARAVLQWLHHRDHEFEIAPYAWLLS